MKKGPLSKKDKQYIEKYRNKFRVERIAKHVERSVEFIEKYIAGIQEVEEAEAAKEQENQPKPPSALDFMGRNQDRGVVVMTQVASEMGDKTRDSRGKNPPSGRWKHCIHTIKKDAK